MTARMPWLLVFAVWFPWWAAYAANELDVTTLSCDVVNKPSPREVETMKNIVVPWIEGYYHRKISLAGMQTDLQGLQGYCQLNPGGTVMNGAQILMGPR